MSLSRGFGIINALKKVATAPTSRLITRSSSHAVDHHDDHHHGPPHPTYSYNDLDVPNGNWEEDYKSRNGEYNRNLGIAGVYFTAMLVTLFTIKYPGLARPPLDNTERGLRFLKYAPDYKEE